MFTVELSHAWLAKRDLNLAIATRVQNVHVTSYDTRYIYFSLVDSGHAWRSFGSFKSLNSFKFVPFYASTQRLELSAYTWIYSSTYRKHNLVPRVLSLPSPVSSTPYLFQSK